jgi:hypothetical protein
VRPTTGCTCVVTPRCEEGEEDLGEPCLGIDHRRVPGALEPVHLHARTAVAVSLEDRADLGDHLLRREHRDWARTMTATEINLTAGAVVD